MVTRSEIILKEYLSFHNFIQFQNDRSKKAFLSMHIENSVTN